MLARVGRRIQTAWWRRREKVETRRGAVRERERAKTNASASVSLLSPFTHLQVVQGVAAPAPLVQALHQVDLLAQDVGLGGGQRDGAGGVGVEEQGLHAWHGAQGAVHVCPDQGNQVLVFREGGGGGRRRRGAAARAGGRQAGHVGTVNKTRVRR